MRRNSTSWNSWLFGAGILISSSGGTVGSGIEIYGNTLEQNGHGIALVQQNRGSGRLGPYKVRNVYVHDNKIKQGVRYAAGVASDDGDSAVFAGSNRFQNNTYCVDNLSASGWAWKENRNWSQWQGFGQDTTGSAHLISSCPFTTTIMPSPSPTPTSTPIPISTPPVPLSKKGDGNKDGKIDLVDMSVLLSYFNKSGDLPPIDMNGDGVINSFDFSLMRKLLIDQGVIKG